MTRDSLFHGRLICQQHRHGYRFSLDSLLAARFCRPDAHAQALDLGAGCGVIGLILVHLWPGLRLQALEVQPSLARLARCNVLANGFQQRMTVVEGDLKQIRDLLPGGTLDLVVSNPPYRPLGRSRISGREEERTRARHETDATLEDVVLAAQYVLRPRGTLVLVLPASRTAEACSLLQRSRLECKRLRSVFSAPADAQARLSLIEAVRNGGAGLSILPPLFIFDPVTGGYSDEMTRWYNDLPRSAPPGPFGLPGNTAAPPTFSTVEDAGPGA